MVDQEVPPSADRSTSYPVMADPPSLAGAVHDRLICDDETAFAVRFVGGPSTSWAFAGAASMPKDDNNSKAKIPKSKVVLLLIFLMEFLFNMAYLTFQCPYTIYKSPIFF